MRLEEVYARYFRRVYAFALSLTRNGHAAEEITQETFFRAMKNPDQFQGRSSVDTYLCSIAHNLYVSSLRQQKRCVPDAGLEAMADESDPEGAAVSRDAARRLHRLLHGLEEPYKEVFSLRVFGELPYQEIGALFEKGESWARVTYFRAKQKLQRMMEEEENG